MHAPLPLLLLTTIVTLFQMCGPTGAQELAWPRCSERLDGQTLCAQASVCECRYDSAGALTGRVAAWRWSCDMLKMCGPPAPAGADPQPLPPGLTYAPGTSTSGPAGSGPDAGGLPTLHIGRDGRIISGR